MKTRQWILVVFLMVGILSAGAQTQELKPFDKISISPRIDLHLQKGAKESVHFEFENIDPSKINVEVRNKKLYLYLDGAKNREPVHRDGNHRYSVYRGGSVHAYVTYRQLSKLVVKGAESVRCDDPIQSDKFTLRLYGEIDAQLASLETSFLRAALYGENKLDIKEGNIDTQIFNLYGQNDVSVSRVINEETRTTSFGENDLELNSNHLSITAFGETDIGYLGNPAIKKRIMLGESAIKPLAN